MTIEYLRYPIILAADVRLIPTAEFGGNEQ